MKSVILAMAAIVLSGPLPAAAQPSTSATQIAEAVQILPEDLRDGATVVTYDAATGARKVLRQGTNFIECQPQNGRRLHTLLQQGAGAAPRFRGEASRREEERRGDPAGGRGGGQGGHAAAAAQGDDVVSRLRQARSHPEPVGDVAAQRHARIGRRVDGEPARCRARRQGSAVDDAAGHARRAHHDSDQPAGEDTRRLPIRRADEITQATLPLPEDLRAGRHRLQVRPENRRPHRPAQGDELRRSACRAAPTDSPGATTRSRRRAAIFSAKLRAQGKADKEIQEAVAGGHPGRHDQADAVRHDVVPALRRRRIAFQLLWVLSVPGATPESIGVSDDSQRDEAIGGDGRPWLMLAGTPGAHIMIPINK